MPFGVQGGMLMLVNGSDQRVFWVGQIALTALSVLAGCHPNTSARYIDKPDLTPLMNAAAQRDLLRLQRLISAGANVNERTKDGVTALYEAIERQTPGPDNLPIVDALLKAGANPNEIEGGMDTLTVSLTRDFASPSVTLVLLRSGARIRGDCGSDDSLLSLATQDSSPEVMRALLAGKAPVNCQDTHGHTALYWAAMNGQADRVSLLLQHGADRELRDNVGRTALDVATTTNEDRRVQAEFAKTRELLLKGPISH
jgi:serine/threonine-protein phosphatase 6 regulatory ankyrin repeat subunit B